MSNGGTVAIVLQINARRGVSLYERSYYHRVSNVVVDVNAYGSGVPNGNVLQDNAVRMGAIKCT